MALRLRHATHADIPALLTLLAELFAQEAEFEADAARQRAGLERILDDPGSGRVYAAELDGTVVACVCTLFTVSTALGERVGLLEDMVVTAQCRGRGIGRELLRYALQRARAEGCARVTLLTDADNLAAHRFYAAAGFERSQMLVFRKLA